MCALWWRRCRALLFSVQAVVLCCFRSVGITGLSLE